MRGGRCDTAFLRAYGKHYGALPQDPRGPRDLVNTGAGEVAPLMPRGYVPVYGAKENVA